MENGEKGKGGGVSSMMHFFTGFVLVEYADVSCVYVCMKRM